MPVSKGCNLDALMQEINNVEYSKEEIMRMDIFYRIKEARERKGWTHKKLAEESNVEEKTIMNMECHRAKPTLMEVLSVCVALDITLEVRK